MKRKIISLLLMTVLAATLFAGCTQKIDTSSPSVSPSSKDVSSQETDSSHYPVTITTYNYAGAKVQTTYEKAPEKVVAVYQGSIETMLALGLESNIVAAAGLDNPVKDEWKDSFAKINYLKEFAPGKEDVLMLKPDMILSWNSYFGEKNLGDVDYWHSAGVNTYINTNTRAKGDRTLENECTDILNLGKIFNVEQKAQALVDEMKNEVARVKTADTSQKKKVLIIEFLSDDITNYGAKSLGGDMVTSLGAELVSPDASKIGKEDVIKLDPDVIFVVYMKREDDADAGAKSVNKVLKDKALMNIKAAKNETVYPIMLGDMYASGVRAMDGINTFAKGIYPEFYK